MSLLFEKTFDLWGQTMKTNVPLLALDIGGSKLMAAIVYVERDDISRNLTPNIRQKSHRVLAPSTTIDELMQEIDSAVSEVFDAAKMAKCDIEAVGVNVPGLADPAAGLWVYACFSGIRDFPIAEIIGKKYGKPIYIENDVNACALAEKYFGACRETDDFLWVTVSNGVGGGLILRGEVFSGSFGNAGEIGHFCVEENAAEAIRCGCGNWGCLEAQAAGPGIAKRYKKQTGKDETAANLAVLAIQGDAVALAVFEKTGYYLGKAIAASVNLINPGKVILGGGVSQSFELFGSELEKTIQRQMFRAANEQLVIEPTHLGNDAALFGATALAFRGLRNKT